MKNMLKIIPMLLLFLVLTSCVKNTAEYNQQNKCIFTEYKKWAVVSGYEPDSGYVICENAASPLIYTFYDDYFTAGYSDSELLPDSIETAQSFDTISYMQIKYDENIWTAKEFDGIVLKTDNNKTEILLVPYDCIDMSVAPIRNDDGTYNYLIK